MLILRIRNYCPRRPRHEIPSSAAARTIPRIRILHHIGRRIVRDDTKAEFPIAIVGQLVTFAERMSNEIPRFDLSDLLPIPMPEMMMNASHCEEWAWNSQAAFPGGIQASSTSKG